jgi:hypothetical protein
MGVKSIDEVRGDIGLDPVGVGAFITAPAIIRISDIISGAVPSAGMTAGPGPMQQFGGDVSNSTPIASASAPTPMGDTTLNIPSDALVSNVVDLASPDAGHEQQPGAPGGTPKPNPFASRQATPTAAPQPTAQPAASPTGTTDHLPHPAVTPHPPVAGTGAKSDIANLAAAAPNDIVNLKGDGAAPSKDVVNLKDGAAPASKDVVNLSGDKPAAAPPAAGAAPAAPIAPNATPAGAQSEPIGGVDPNAVIDAAIGAIYDAHIKAGNIASPAQAAATAPSSVKEPNAPPMAPGVDPFKKTDDIARLGSPSGR